MRTHLHTARIAVRIIIIILCRPIERAHIQQAVRGALKHSRVKRNNY